MDLARRHVIGLAIIGFLLGSAFVVTAAHLSGTVLISGGVTIVAPDGMAVTIDGETDANLEDPFTLGGTVNVVTEDGNATFFSSGAANATVHKDDIEGTWTNVTAIDADPNSVQINPDDKSQVTVAQQITVVEWTGSYTADDGTVDFTYEATGGPGEVTLNGAPASTTLYAIDADNDEILDVADSDGSGSVTFDALESGDHDVLLQTNVNDAPVLSNASPQGDQSGEPMQFSVDVNDSNLPNGDSVDVAILFDGSQIHSETITTNSTVTATVPEAGKDGGTHQWSVEADDDFGGSTDAQYTYNVPSEITFRDEQRPHAIIKDDVEPIRVEAIFYEDIDVDPTVVNRSTTDGTIALDGLPVSSEFSVSVSAPGYHNRTVRLDDIYTQSDIFLIPKTESTVENRFVVNDRTGSFPPEDTQLSIEAPVNRSEYDANANGYEWMTVSGDDLGADEAYVDDLIEEKRYRLVVENDDGDRRVLGSYTPETTGTIALTIGRVDVNPQEGGSVAMDAEWINETSQTPQVRVEYNDTAQATDTLYLNIYERNNESNVLMDNESFTGPFGTFTHTETVPAGENETTWVVEVVGDRGTDEDGEAVENVGFKQFVGPNIHVLGEMSPWLVTVIFVGVVWGVAGMFSQVNGHVGGIVVAGIGGMFFFVGLVPPYLGGGVVALALLTAGLLFVRESRGGAF